MTDLAAYPKVELHLHLEGAAPPALTRRLATARGVDPDRLIGPDGAYRWDDFTGFIATYDAVAALYETPEEVRALTEAVLGTCAAHGVIYAEITLSPDHAGGDAPRWAEHLAAVAEGAAAAEARCGIVARGIATGVRHLGPEAVARTAGLVVAAPHPFLVGWGLAGDERAHRAADFAPAFAIAREAGLGLTAHAGELRGADGVRETLDALRPVRVGHGARAVEDAALVARLADEAIALELCPGSNVALGVAADWRAHPIHALARAGCRVTVSTDDPPFFRTTMTREYDELAACGWSAPALARLATTALDAAFCDAATRARLRQRLGSAGDAPPAPRDYPAPAAAGARP